MKYLLLFFLLFSCTSAKVTTETENIKMGMQPFVQSKPALYSTSKKGVYQLILRLNGSFEFFVFDFPIHKYSYYAGWFTKNLDTLKLNFYKNKKPSLFKDYIVIRKKSQQLIFQAADTSLSIDLNIIEGNLDALDKINSMPHP